MDTDAWAEWCEMKSKIAKLEAELKGGDYWMKRSIAFQESGGCPVCFATDEAGHEESCPWGRLERGLEAMKKGTAVRIADLEAKIARMLKRSKVCDAAIVNYEQWCVRIKKLCGGDVSSGNISDTIEVVERKIEEARETLAVKGALASAWQHYQTQLAKELRRGE